MHDKSLCLRYFIKKCKCLAAGKLFHYELSVSVDSIIYHVLHYTIEQSITSSAINFDNIEMKGTYCIKWEKRVWIFMEIQSDSLTHDHEFSHVQSETFTSFSKIHCAERYRRLLRSHFQKGFSGTVSLRNFYHVFIFNAPGYGLCKQVLSISNKFTRSQAKFIPGSAQ
uniref:Uncharacterized protein n=1 Tax=Rhizophagus irregularis (strain DAOM 181602 / DAOM 197198 / MUCL 43194) TaxID=747089 RepID=U9URJ8_RHIID